MIDILRQWYLRHFSDPQVVILALLLIFCFGVVIFMGDVLAPFIAAVILAYMLEALVSRMQILKIPRLPAVIIVLMMFFLLCGIVFFWVVPLLIRQIGQLVKELPTMIEHGKQQFLLLLQMYPGIFSESQIQSMIDSIRKEIVSTGQAIVSASLASAVNVFTFLVYIILVPMMVFFALKDKALILKWCRRFLPQKRELAIQVWQNVDIKIGSYIRGKFIEIMIIWSVTYASFAIMGLSYAMLLGFLVGISVIIPYVGAVAVTVPVALIAYFQWGFTGDFWWLMGTYMVIQILDGNLLVPLLFSEVVNLHPIAIIVAILFFGGIWGVWGIFFAIPLATLVDTVVNAWPAFDEV